MRRRQRLEEESNRDRWLISYADFITLLFAFFVVMYSISSVNEGKYRVLSDSIVRAFSADASNLVPAPAAESRVSDQALAPVPQIVPIPARPLQESLSQKALKMNAMQQLAEQVSSGFDDLVVRGLISVDRNKDSIVVEINSELLFAIGSATLFSAAVDILSRTAATLAKNTLYIEVEGFTDNLPIQTSVFPSNWELSAARAASVVHLFTKLGIDPGRMVAVGYGEHRPKVSNNTEQGRRQNRRVVLVISSSPRNAIPSLGIDKI